MLRMDSKRVSKRTYLGSSDGSNGLFDGFDEAEELRIALK